MAQSTISYLWRDQKAASGFRTGVSLHSHTNQSKETLDFLANLGNQYPVLRTMLSRLESRSESVHGVRVDYARSYWTPPMTPKLAFDLESRQIEKLDVRPMVSLTDHDSIKAPMLLRTVPSARQIPVSVEWSAPYGGVQSFHLGSAQPAERPRHRMDGDAGELSPRTPAMRGLLRFWSPLTRNPMSWWFSTIPCGIFIWSARRSTSSW